MLYDTLVSATTVAEHLNDKSWRIIDCRFSLAAPEAGRQSYLEAHIPGASYAHLDQDLSAARAPGLGRHPLPDRDALARRCSTWGIDQTSQVVVYDSDNGMFAARLWWLMRWLGHERVALLDGGLAGWQSEGYPVSATVTMCEPTSFYPAAPLEQTIESTELLGSLDDSTSSLLIDVRAAERYAGEIEPLDPVAGHVPGALNVPLQQNLDEQGRFLPAEKLQQRYSTILAGRVPQHVSVMCGSGVTACHTLLALRLAGLPGARLYAGSWSEWITDPHRPVARGAQP